MNPRRSSWLWRLLVIAPLASYAVARASPSSEDDSSVDVEGVHWKTILEEEDEIGFIQGVQVDLPPIASLKSKYQKVEVYSSDHFGRVFVLDDCLQLTERDASHYNEMFAHVPVFEYLSRFPEEERLKVLVIGGGDGYVVSELLKHPTVEAIDHIELDEGVIEVAKKHLPWKDAWESPKVNLVVGDGAEFVKKQSADSNHDGYNVIIQDSSDPFWIDDDGEEILLPSHVLYTEDHLGRIHKLLRKREGVFFMQAETYNIPSNLKAIRRWRESLQSIGFDEPRYGSISIATYPTGQIGFLVAHAKDAACDSATCKYDERDGDMKWGIDWPRIDSQFKKLVGKTSYYHPSLHKR